MLPPETPITGDLLNTQGEHRGRYLINKQVGDLINTKGGNDEFTGEGF